MSRAEPDAAAAGKPVGRSGVVTWLGWWRSRLATADELLALLAAGLLPLGLIMIFLGWYGASHTPYLFEQVPYLLSGGLLGLGLVCTGGFVLFGSWIARTARAQQARTAELLEELCAVREELVRCSAVPPPPVQRTGRKRPAGAQSPAEPTGRLVATARGSMLHRPDCAVVSDRDDVHVVESGAMPALQPCRLCHPLTVPTRG